MAKMLPSVITLIIITALAVAGCTNPTTNTTTSPTPIINPDTQLARYIDVYHQIITEQHPKNLTAFNVTWKNNTTAYIRIAYTIPPHGNITYNLFRENSTLIKFDSFDAIPPYVYRHTTNITMGTTTPINNSYNQHVAAYQRMEDYYHEPFIYIEWAGPTYVSNHTSVAENVVKYSTYGQFAEQIYQYLWIVDYGNEMLETTA